MFELVNKKRNNLKKNKKGFTLVEVIVVLVILAILAAILIPTMIGWINKADKKTAVVEARSVALAAQVVVSDNHGTFTGDTAETTISKTENNDLLTEIQALAEIKKGVIGEIQVDGGSVTKFAYRDSSGKYDVVYDANEEGEAKYAIKDATGDAPVIPAAEVKK